MELLPPNLSYILYPLEIKATFESFLLECSLDDRCIAFAYHKQGYGFLCDKIKCIVRRKMVTSDLDDFSFTPGDTGTKMHIPAGYSYILMN